MRKIIFSLPALVIIVLCGCSDYDDSRLRQQIDDYMERLEILKEKAKQLNSEITSLGKLTSGNVITSVTTGSDGKYMITYLDNDNIERTIEIATADQIVDLPLIGVSKEDGVYYWTVVVDGETSWLLDEKGTKVPVTGHTPKLSVDNDGYWTVDEVRVTGPNGQSVKANDEKSAIISSAEVDGNGNLIIILPDNTVITLQVFEGLNLSFACEAVTTVGDVSRELIIPYTLSGVSASYAIVDIAKTENLKAVINRSESTVTISFEPGFGSAYIIMLAYDLAENTIIKPLFFRSSSEGIISISSAAELVAFAAAVNVGGEGAVSQAILTSDIDMTGVTSWVPIGNATFSWASNTVTITGNPYKGIFDGQGYAIKNFNIKGTNSTDGGVFGLFGILDGATIKNLKIGTADYTESSSMTILASAVTDCGIIAGMCYDSKVTDCINHASLEYNGSSDGRVTMAMVGFAFTDATSSEIKNCINYGAVNATTSNNQNGATAIQCAGILGFSTNDVSSTLQTIISGCDNYGDMNSVTARTSGIVAAANRYTMMEYCTNYGNQINSFATNGNGRLGNITCITGTGCTLLNCINRGNLISTTSGRCGGIVSLPNHAANTFENCANYGEIITDSSFRGLFFGYNTVACSWINCVTAGKLGIYNNGLYEYYALYEEVMKETYLGPQNVNTPAQFQNIVYEILGESGGGESQTPATLKILFIGNSFTKDAVEHLPGIVKAAGISNLKMVHMYYGGRTINEYNGGYSTVSDYICYKCNAGSTIWAAYSGYRLQDIVYEDDWDIISIQEHTGKKVAWEWTATEKNDIEELIFKIKADQPGTPKFVYIMSQAYADINILSSYGQSSVLTNNFSSQAEMFAAITAQGQKILNETPVEEVIPTGTVLQNLRTSSLNNSYDLTRDGYHMDYGISRYAAACAVFESIISPSFSNVKLDNNNYRYTNSNTSDGAYSTPVTDINAPIALQAARYALATPFAVTNMQ